MEEISNTVHYAIGKYRDFTEHEERSKAEIKSLVENYGYETREENTQRLAKIIANTKDKKSEDDRVARKIADIEEILEGYRPTDILDVGAGSGEILMGMIKHFKTEKAYAVEPKLEAKNFPFTVLKNYEDIPDNSVDLITVLETFHHINPADRENILIQLHRILKPGGRLIIEEHDYNETPAMYTSLDIYHNYWYIVEKEDYDPLHLMSLNSCKSMIEKLGFESLKNSMPKGWQRIYWASFQKTQ